MRAVLNISIAVMLSIPVVQAAARIDYIAHACFRIESDAGHSVVIDPYNTNRWLGYHFPPDISASAVLITHPHYDHDASYYWSSDVPVFRAAGEYSVGDIRIVGLAGSHAEPYGKEFGQRNTVWLVEVDGVRILHVGDSGPLSDEIVRRVGRVDVLMLPVDDLDHILKRGEIEEMRRRLKPSVVVPMHYRLEVLSKLPESVGPLDEWLTGQANVRRLELSSVLLKKETLGAKSEVYVFKPSPAVTPWSAELHRAWAARDAARDSDDETAKVRLLTKAQTLAPGALPFSVELAEALFAAGQRSQAKAVLQSALAGAGRGDWEYRNRGRILLARIYSEDGNLEAAAEQYRLVLKEAFRTAWRDEAQKFLSTGSNAPL